MGFDRKFGHLAISKSISTSGIPRSRNLDCNVPLFLHVGGCVSEKVLSTFQRKPCARLCVCVLAPKSIRLDHEVIVALKTLNCIIIPSCLKYATWQHSEVHIHSCCFVPFLSNRLMVFQRRNPKSFVESVLRSQKPRLPTTDPLRT